MIPATLCYIKKNGHTLMLHRVKKANDMHEGKWNGLGGKVKSGETPEECVIREVREESGLNIKTPRLRGVLTFPKFDGKNDWLVFVFTAADFNGSIIDSSEGNLKWVPDGDILKLELWEGDRIFLEWLEQNKFFSGKFVYNNGKLKSHQVAFY